MDSSLSMVPDGDLTWSDTHSMDSDDHPARGIPQSPVWMDNISTSSASTSIMSTASQAFHQTGQLSPISTGIDIPGSSHSDQHGCLSATSHSSSAPGMIHSNSSSYTDSWSIGYVDPDDVSGPNMDNDMQWDQDSEEILAVPKIEPMDEDDFRLEDVKEANITPAGSSAANLPPAVTKRPRGRPRKHFPVSPVVLTPKVTKGRSKTGCITCRKRKKKCDEAKPRCMNCEKNAVVCEGYPEKQIWKSGKERAEERLHKTQALPVITMQPIFSGLETNEDMLFWKYYNDHLSTVLTVEGEHKNAFKDMLIPIATQHEGLMHSILALSSKHLDYDTPYAAVLLKKWQSSSNPVTVEALTQRADYHHEKAIEKLYEGMSAEENKEDPNYKVLLSARYGQMLCLLLEALAEGNPRGEHRLHLQAYQRLIQESPPEDPAFLAFITEFFQFHIFADELIFYPSPASVLHQSRLAVEDWVPPGGLGSLHPPRLLGVADGLFGYLCQITTIRNQIRNNIAAQLDPVVDYTSLYRAAEIDAAIRDWEPHWPPGDSRDRVSLLYKQMMWVYLFRTIYPPAPLPNSASTSSTSLAAAPPANTSHTTVGRLSPVTNNTPPRSVSASCASSPSPKIEAMDTEDHTNPRRHSIANPRAAAMVTPSTQDSRASPPPIRRPPDHDSRITLAVDESLTILESFKPSDPSQTLLLIPCLVIGTAAFAPLQQERIRAAIKTVRGYTGLRNTDRVAELLDEVWRLMEDGDWQRVWDWQGVARNMGMDFMCR